MRAWLREAEECWVQQREVSREEGVQMLVFRSPREREMPLLAGYKNCSVLSLHWGSHPEKYRR